MDERRVVFGVVPDLGARMRAFNEDTRRYGVVTSPSPDVKGVVFLIVNGGAPGNVTANFSFGTDVNVSADFLHGKFPQTPGAFNCRKLCTELAVVR